MGQNNNELKILGLSEATLTMIFDILESNNSFPSIKIINNINYIPTKEYINKKFNISIEEKDNFDNKNYYILGVTQVKTKQKLLEYFEDIPTTNFKTIISKNTDISTTTNIGNGCIINGMVCIAGHSTIEDFVFVNRGVSIGHHTIIGSGTTINPNANIAGNVFIGNNCQIGLGVNIFDGIKIGDNTIIGAGSLVTKDIPSNVVAYGNPCKIIRSNI
jgi:sugar O-acyltransferase (sialic acid O-acetyltransferase NeuD family)